MGNIVKIIFILFFLSCCNIIYSQGVQKQLIGKVTSSVFLTGSAQVAFSSDFGYTANDIQSGDRYSVRTGTNVIEYRIDSTSTSGLLGGFNLKLYITALNGYSGSFPTATAEIFRPTTNMGLSLLDNSAPAFLQWGLVNRNMILIDSVMGTFNNSVDWALGGNNLTQNETIGSNTNFNVGIEARDTVRLTVESDGDIRTSNYARVVNLNSLTSFSGGLANISTVFANNNMAYIGLLDGTNGLFQTQRVDTSGTIKGKYLHNYGIINIKTFESRFYDLDYSNYIAIAVKNTIPANFTLYYPSTPPASNGQVLKGDTNGTLYFDDVTSAQQDTTYTLTVGTSTIKIVGSDSITASIISGHITLTIPAGKHLTKFSSFIENTDMNYTDGTFVPSAGLRISINNVANTSIVVERPLRLYRKLFTGDVSTSNPAQSQNPLDTNEVIYSNTSGVFSFAYNDLKSNSPNGVIISF